MGTHISRSRFGEPSTELATALGRLLVSAAQLRHLAATVTAGDADAWPAGAAPASWTEFTMHLLELEDRIRAAAAVMRFTGSAGEHLTIIGADEVRIPADAAYVATLSRRMDRHTRLGRVLLSPSASESLPA